MSCCWAAGLADKIFLLNLKEKINWGDTKHFILTLNTQFQIVHEWEREKKMYFFHLFLKKSFSDATLITTIGATDVIMPLVWWIRCQGMHTWHYFPNCLPERWQMNSVEEWWESKADLFSQSILAHHRSLIEGSSGIFLIFSDQWVHWSSLTLNIWQRWSGEDLSINK